MGDIAYIGEIRVFSFGYATYDWMQCEGQELQIGQYQALFAVIGYTYGGQANRTFKLPDLRGLAAVGVGTAPGGQTPRGLGKSYGAGDVTLTSASLPPHTHKFLRPGGVKPFADKFSEPSNIGAPGAVANVAGGAVNALRNAGAPDTALASLAVSAVGGGLSHDNRQPYLPLNFCICVTGGEYPVKP